MYPQFHPTARASTTLTQTQSEKRSLTALRPPCALRRPKAGTPGRLLLEGGGGGKGWLNQPPGAGRSGGCWLAVAA